MMKNYLIIAGIFLLSFFIISGNCYGNWAWPTNGETDLNIHGQFTSEYGPNDWDDAEEYAYRFHDGIDIDTDINDDIYAAHSGIVEEIGTHNAYGKYMVIKADNGTDFTRYCHLKTNSLNFNVNDQVDAGEEIATTGLTGNSTSYHLHFERWEDGDDWENGYKRHPLKYMNCTSGNVELSYTESNNDDFEFQIVVNSQRLQVDSISVTFTGTNDNKRSFASIDIGYSPPDDDYIPIDGYLSGQIENVYVDYENFMGTWECRYYKLDQEDSPVEKFSVVR